MDASACPSKVIGTMLVLPNSMRGRPHARRAAQRRLGKLILRLAVGGLILLHGIAKLLDPGTLGGSRTYWPIKDSRHGWRMAC